MAEMTVRMGIRQVGLAKADSQTKVQRTGSGWRPRPKLCFTHLSYVVSLNLQNVQIREVFINIPIVGKTMGLRERRGLV